MVIDFQQSGEAEIQRRYPGKLGRLLLYLDALTNSIRFSAARMPRRVKRVETDLLFSVLRNTNGAIYLSIAFGVLARRIRFCSYCENPFVTDLASPRRRLCDSCHGVGAHWQRRAMGLPRRLYPMYNTLRKRLDQRVSRGTLSSGDRQQILLAALDDLRQVQSGKTPLAQWQIRWDTKQRRGRRPKASIGAERIKSEVTTNA